ncbi:TspO/MBR family protein [Cryptosporangium aurantiacum]|uniref:TspO and MBR related proteins n=1 Tax=Cryptosporangium aurantiacum TaxID=134849 RepID=A0A1M7TUQ4_9ACTN|nr:TspO/MBR family protein [Cryptosporangium aurantiacum]SHN74479.1 TspO and MBR related proteins [Cryptosporangium aurantiacum]
MASHGLSMTRHDGVALIGFLAAAFATAAVGGLASVDAGTYYNGLDRPAWAPPSGLFGPVWTVLYTLIGIAGWLAWRRGGFRAAPAAFALYAGQLVLNAAWTWLFFAGEQPGAAFAEITVLWLVILATAVLFARRSRPAGLLLVPYLAWVGYAAALNFALWTSN